MSAGQIPLLDKTEEILESYLVCRWAGWGDRSMVIAKKCSK